MEFTRNTSKILAIIYKQYLENKKSGRSDVQSRTIDSEDLTSLSSMHDSDVMQSLNELKNAGFIKLNINGVAQINDTLIIQMENRFKKGLVEVSKYLIDLGANIAVNIVF